ncbi:MAG: hypothetical protein L3J21_02950 [Devosiaceae bacterium]|nr:hypothetical protein [Devosiaceae bacterium]
MAHDLIGKSGRKVRCANCQKDWRAFAEQASDGQNQPGGAQKHEDKKEKTNEDEMDAEFEALEKENQPPEPLKQSEKNHQKSLKEKSSDKLSKSAQQRADMEWRKSAINRTMPRAKMRRAVRIAGTVVFTLLILSVVIFRGNIVRAFPDLAGVYQSIGLGVNVVGLEFSKVETLKSLNDGGNILYITAEINSVSSGQVNVPRVMISLLDEDGISVFDWSVTLKETTIMPGGWIALHTQLSSPPPDSRSVRLAFESID